MDLRRDELSDINNEWTVVEQVVQGSISITFFARPNKPLQMEWMAVLSNGTRLVIHYHPIGFPERPYVLEAFHDTGDVARHVTIKRYLDYPNYETFREDVMNGLSYMPDKP